MLRSFGIFLFVVTGLLAEESSTMADVQRPSAWNRDEPIRLIRLAKEEIITRSDIFRLRELELFIHRQRGEPPLSATNLVILEKTILEQLTDLMLFGQETDRLGYKVDVEEIRREVQQWARNTSGVRTIEDQAAERERRVKDRKRMALLSYYSSRWPDIGPEDLRTSYLQTLYSGVPLQSSLTYEGVKVNASTTLERPKRVQILKLQVRPSTPSQKQEILTKARVLFRDIGGNAVLASAISDADRKRYLEAPDDQRLAILLERLRASLAIAVGKDEFEARRLQIAARETIDSAEKVKTASDVEQDLNALRLGLLAQSDLGKRQETFVAALKARSLDATPAWIALSDANSAFMTTISQAQAGNVPAVWWDENESAYVLVLVLERDDSGKVPFSEAQGSLLMPLQFTRREKLSRAIAASLRSRAYIVDLAPLRGK
jgi:hypothetical protein